MRLHSAILSYFFPKPCLGCRSLLDFSEEEPLCKDCSSKIIFLEEPFCRICGDPFLSEEATSHLCHDCLKEPPPFERARSVFRLDPPLSSMIHAFKYQGTESALPWFIEKMTDFLRTHQLNSFDWLVPVPLHPFRLMRRGYNQALSLARGLGKALQTPVEFKSLIRKHYEASQVKGSKKVRARQVAGSFTVKKDLPFKEKKVLLVDDVYTTGATVAECAKVLKQAGARVQVFTLARTLLRNLRHPLSW